MLRPTHLYLVEVCTYGTSNPIKIGVSFDPIKRLHGLHAIGISLPVLLGSFVFEDRFDALRIEHAACRHFPQCPRYADRCPREVLDATLEELLAFIRPRARGRQFVQA